MELMKLIKQCQCCSRVNYRRDIESVRLWFGHSCSGSPILPRLRCAKAKLSCDFVSFSAFLLPILAGSCCCRQCLWQWVSHEPSHSTSLFPPQQQSLSVLFYCLHCASLSAVSFESIRSILASPHTSSSALSCSGSAVATTAAAAAAP